MSAATSLLSVLPEREHDRLFPLMKEAPTVVERMTRHRPHRCTLLRHATRGVAGVKLRTVSVGRCRMTTARWLVEFWASVEVARTVPNTQERRTARGGRNAS